MVATEPTPSGNPGKTAFHYPSSGKRTEAGGEELLPVDLLSLGHQQTALGHGEGAYWLHGPAHLLFEPGDEGPSVMTISPHQLELGKLVFQRREQGFRSCLIGAIGPQHFHAQQVQRREQGFRSCLIGAIGPQHFHAQQVTLGVNQQVF